MKSIARFLLVLSCVAPFCAANAVVSQTAGSNLTAYNGESGSTNNNRWNNLTNARSIAASGSNATADFGNCNAVIMRCAQPKCANGGCTDMSVTSGIVSGCVQSNASCKQYGDELVQYIAAQLVAQSTAKANAAASAAQTAAANAAAQQNAQQMQQMQQQMQQMQSQMAQQNAQQMAQLQSALEEQKQLTANAIAEATAAREVAPVQSAQSVVANTNDLNNAQLSAAQNGVSADILAREQISGQIMSALENAQTQLKTLKATMTDTFNYAGCDSRGNNCTGPKRVKTFKQKAEGFFDPYENVLDELYDALILAQSVGVDITDIYMMLNGSCNVWGQYLCSSEVISPTETCLEWDWKTETIDGKTTTIKTCKKSGFSSASTGTHSYNENNCKGGKSIREGYARGGHECTPNFVIPPEDDVSCTLNKTIIDNKDDPVQRDWLWAETNMESGANIRVGCASSALESSVLFRNRKKQASIDIETLEKIIAQDAPATISKYRKNNVDETTERVKFCAVGAKEYTNLQKWVATKGLPSKVCMSEANALRQISDDSLLTASGERMMKRVEAAEMYDQCTSTGDLDDCETIVPNKAQNWANPYKLSSGQNTKSCCAKSDAILCMNAGGTKWENSVCSCGDNTEYRSDYIACMTNKEYCAMTQQMPNGDNACYDSCDKYCTDGGKNDVCKKSETNTELTEGKKCVGSWDTTNKSCVCEEK